MSYDQGGYARDPLIRAFGSVLRSHREAARLSRPQLAEALGCGAQWIEKLETAQKPPSKATADDLDTFFKTPGTFRDMCDEIKNAGKRVALPPWFKQWVELEQKADALRAWEPLVVPGLLQTPEYARAMEAGKPGTTDDELEKVVTSRMERQAILTGNSPALFRAHIDEGALYRLVGSPQVMHDQLVALVDALERKNVSVLLVPSDTGCTAGLSGAFWIASIEGEPDTVLIEGATEGRVSDHPREVAEIWNRYDAIRDEALPARSSVELIMKVLKEKWAQT